MVKENKVATLESTQFDKIIGRYPSAMKTYSLLKDYFIKSQAILDYGSGNGIFLRILQKNNHNTFGWEPSCDLVEAVNIFQNVKQNYSDISKLDNFTFDVIVSLRTFAYIPNKEDIIRYWSTKLNTDGFLILENSNPKYWVSKYRSDSEIYPGWEITKELEKEFYKYFELEKIYIGYSPYYRGTINDSFMKNITKRIMNNFDRVLGKYMSFFAPHYIYVYKKIR